MITQQQFITNLYQLDACGRGFSDTIVPIINTNVSGSKSETLFQSSNVSSAIRFLL